MVYPFGAWRKGDHIGAAEAPVRGWEEVGVRETTANRSKLPWIKNDDAITVVICVHAHSIIEMLRTRAQIE